MGPCDIGVILTFHREGLLAQSTLRSAWEAKARAEARGLRVEVTVVADQPDPATAAVLGGWRAQGHTLRLIESEAGDVGHNRNAAIAATPARFIATLDGDDLWCPDWLTAAATRAMEGARRVIWHPEANLYFGQRGAEHWFMHPDMDAPGFDVADLVLVNPWTALCLAPREIFLDVPYPPSNVKAGFGFEDWHWNRATVARGVVHKTVPGTVHFIRQKPVSLMRSTAATGGLMVPLSP